MQLQAEERQELEQLRALVQMKSLNAVAEFCDGLEFALTAAERGEPRAIAVLRSVSVNLERLEALKHRLRILHG